MAEEKKKILVVDDDIDVINLMKLQLESFGFEVTTAGSQKEGEKLIKEFRPHLAILDLMMENQDSGFILCYKMKKSYPDVPVIIATSVTAETGIQFGVDTESDRNWIKADRYLEKGIRPDQLNREIRKLLKI